MENIIYKYGNLIEDKKVYELYENVGWVAYTDDFDSLKEGIENSLSIISAWDDDRLIGLIRVVGDGKTIIYVQDILVLEEYQGRGIGSILFEKMLDKYKNVRQKILLTDDIDANIKFYEKNWMEDVSNLNCVAFMYMKR